MTDLIVGPTSDCWDGTHIKFIIQQPDPKKKTVVWHVKTKDEKFIIGVVKWFSAWRKYCFFPCAETVFEEVCLSEIAQFIADRTKDHKEGV